ncbi:hypothetical protein [Corynebacterium urogenitale]
MSPIDTLYSLPGVRRGWPAKNGAIIFEQVDDNGHIRAGHIDTHGDIHLLPYATDPKLPSLDPEQLAETQAELLVHRYRKRAVIHHGEAITKYVRPGKAATIAQRATQVRSICRPLGLGAAQVSDQTDSSVTYSLLPGHTLHTLGDRGKPGWETFLQLWGGFMGAQGGVEIQEVYGADREAATLAHWITTVERYGAHPRIGELKDAAGTVAGELWKTPDKHVLLHRDLHDKQLLWDGATLSVLDVDTAAWGEGALDLGNLLAHVHLRRIQGIYSGEFAAELDAQLRAFADQHEISARRLNAYARGTAVRLACLYAFRPTSEDWLQEWTDLALDGGELGALGEQ